MRIYAPSRMQSVKDLPAETRLKFRCSGALGVQNGAQRARLAAQAGSTATRRVLAAVPPSRPPAAERHRAFVRFYFANYHADINSDEADQGEAHRYQVRLVASV